MGANRKALVFTESRRTQDYLKDFLESNDRLIEAIDVARVECNWQVVQELAIDLEQLDSNGLA